MEEVIIDTEFLKLLDEKLFRVNDWRIHFKDSGKSVLFITKTGKNRTLCKIIGLDNIECPNKAIPKYVIEFTKKQIRHYHDLYMWSNSEYSVTVGELRAEKEKNRIKRKVNSFY
jgi:hypothetical protein